MRIRSRWLVGFAAVVFAHAMKALFSTLRLSPRLGAVGTNPYDKECEERFLFCVWHDSMVIPTFGGQHRHTAALTSHHIDGSFVAQVLRAVGIASVRGSTSHGGAHAIRRLMAIARDKHLVVTPDGPRGPRREMSRGIVYLASRTKRAIVPTAFSCRRCWRIKGSWTDLVIPMPFTEVFMLTGSPVRVPPELQVEKLLGYVQQVQEAMDNLASAADRLAAASSKVSSRESGKRSACSVRPE